MKLNKGKWWTTQLARPAHQMVARLALLLVSVGLLALGVRASLSALADEPRPSGKAVPEQRYFAGQAVSPGGQGATPGRINGIKVAIPVQYQHFGPEYLGESPWIPHRPRPNRTFDSPMRSFSVYVQLPDMKPRGLETEASFQDSFKNIDNLWVSGHVDVATVGENPPPPEVGIRRLAAHVLREYDPMRKNCRFVRQPELRYGLVEYITQCPDLEALLREEERVGRSREGATSFYERIYIEANPRDQPVYIRCGFLPPENKRGLGSCKHYFPVPELNVIGDVSYRTKHLAEWHDIQTKLQKLFASFRVESSDAAPQAKPIHPHTEFNNDYPQSSADQPRQPCRNPDAQKLGKCRAD